MEILHKSKRSRKTHKRRAIQNPQVDIAVTFAAIVAICLVYLYQRRNRLPYPPGPRGFPIFGNIFDIPEKRQWLTYGRWSQEFNSPILYLRVLGTHIIVVNDHETAQDLFEKRSDIYSERPRMPMLNEAVGFGWNFGFTADTQHWKVCRREFDLRFRQIASRTFRPHHVKMTHQLLKRFLDTPQHFMKHLRYMTGSLILDISYGIKVKPEDDEYIEFAEKAQEGMEKSGDTNIVDIIPWVLNLPTWLPGMGWMKQILIWRSWSSRMRDVPFEWVKGQLEKGNAKPSLTTDLLDKFEGPTSDKTKREYYIKSIAASLYSAGSDTTVSGLNTLVLTMMLYPDIQRKAHAELDRVVGSDRLPEFADEKDLPYITAIIKEILRWAAFVPFAVPHKTSTENVYKGYYIPKGATVLGNSWTILHDPQIYPEPDEFDPDRFLTPDGRLDPNVPNPETAFGYGRRICPGRFMAFDSMWIAAACLLAVFDFNKPVDKDGEEIVPTGDLFNTGLVFHPLPFQCDIKPRSERAISLIHGSLADEY